MSSNLVAAERRRIGDDLQVGPLGYGCWRFTSDDLGEAQRLIETALDAQMTLIDTADVYGLDYGGAGFGANEAMLGRVLDAAPHLRDRMVLATKGGITPPVPYDSSADYMRSACDASLKRLQTEVIDLYQIHRHDLYTHPAEVAGVLAELREAGKVREVGVSNFTPDQYDALAAHLPFPMATSQPEFSAAELGPIRDGTLDRCMRDGVTPLAWSPLGGGRLLGDAPGELASLLDRLAEREEVDRAAILLAFVLAHPSRPVAIIGTQRPERIGASVAALGVHLDRNDVYDIIEASEGVPLP